MTYRGAQNLIKRGDEPALRQALDTGLDPNLVNQNGWTLLMLAAIEGDVHIGRLLIEKGAAIHAHNNKKDTASTLATHRGHTLFTDLLNQTSTT
jgi:hypothetical protein